MTRVLNVYSTLVCFFESKLLTTSSWSWLEGKDIEFTPKYFEILILINRDSFKNLIQPL